jgi:hypothetical protein
VAVCGADAGEAGEIDVGGGVSWAQWHERGVGVDGVGCDKCLWGDGVLGSAGGVSVGAIEGAEDHSRATRVPSDR